MLPSAVSAGQLISSQRMLKLKPSMLKPNLHMSGRLIQGLGPELGPKKLKKLKKNLKKRKDSAFLPSDAHQANSW